MTHASTTKAKIAAFGRLARKGEVWIPATTELQLEYRGLPHPEYPNLWRVVLPDHQVYMVDSRNDTRLVLWDTKKSRALAYVGRRTTNNRIKWVINVVAPDNEPCSQHGPTPKRRKPRAARRPQQPIRQW